MTEPHVRRRLAAILAADVAGFSRLMSGDEEGVHARLQALEHDVVAPLLEQYAGHIFKNTGDGFLAEFASVVDAVRCALAVQSAVAEHESGEPDEALRFRIGINRRRHRGRARFPRRGREPRPPPAAGPSHMGGETGGPAESQIAEISISRANRESEAERLRNLRIQSSSSTQYSNREIPYAIPLPPAGPGGARRRLQYEKAIRLSPRDPNLGIWLMFIGWSHMLLSQDAEALDWLLKAAAANPAFGVTQAMLAAAYALNGRVDEAQDALAQYRRLIPNTPVLRLILDQPSENPVFRAQLQRLTDALKKAGLEG